MDDPDDARALCRTGDPTPGVDGHDWTDALHQHLDEQIVRTWSLHPAAAGVITTLTRPPGTPEDR